jgi:type I restriction enzyme, S subunit
MDGHVSTRFDLPTDKREDGEVPVVTSSGISSTHSKAVAQSPGIVTGRYGTIGQFHLITENYWPLNTTLYSIELYENNPRFLQYMLSHMSPLFLLNAVKSAVPGIDRNDIHPIRTAVPPPAEQEVIAEFLDRETAKIDALSAKIHEGIEKLKEYRTALISAAVTGKIDVREEICRMADSPERNGANTE